MGVCGHRIYPEYLSGIRVRNLFERLTVGKKNELVPFVVVRTPRKLLSQLRSQAWVTPSGMQLLGFTSPEPVPQHHADRLLHRSHDTHLAHATLEVVTQQERNFANDGSIAT